MTNDEVMRVLRSDTPLNQARAAFSGASAQLEQAGMQRRPPGPIEVRRMEIDAVRRIAKILGVEFDADGNIEAALKAPRE